MATITGTTSANKTKYSYYITWSETDVNVTNNTSLVTASVYVKKIGDYNSSSSSNPHDLWIDGTKFSDNNAIDMNPETTPRLCVSGSKTVTHSANGSKSINISSSGTLPSGSGYGPVSGSASATVSLTTIPREAYITNSVSFVIGNSIPVTLVNAGLQYVQALTYVNGTLIKTQNLGQVTSGTLTFSAGEISNMYAQIPSATSCSMFVRIKTYSDSGYTTQIGSSRDQTGTASINTATNVPTFTTWAVANVDKNIVVKDKYENTLITSSTSTLLGADTKALSGYSKVRATIASANKAVALNSATMSKYRFVAGSKYTEANYSADSTVTIDIDNVTTGSYFVTAQDSRALTTSVSGSLTLISPTPVSLWNLKLERANGVDQAVTMSFVGSMWKEYFGGGTAGVQNTVVCEWRYKETSQAWGSQSWTAITGDLVIDNVGSISYEDGIGNFDTDKSYSVEIRMYDKISQVLISGTIDVGTPVMDITKSGVSFLGKYDPTEGGAIQLYSKNINLGWIPANESWSYASPTTITVPSGATSKYQKGMPFKLTANSVELQGYIVNIDDTLLTVVGDALTNHDFTDCNYAISGTSPVGFDVWFDWSPTTSGITVGDGELLTRFAIEGKNVYFFVRFELGSTSAITGRNQFSLPVAGAGYGTGMAFIQDTGTEVIQGQAFWDTANMFVDYVNTGGTYGRPYYFSSTAPMTWASGDWYVTSGVYQLYN